jgi:diguanylate cyclase (GGDEF)-like protein
MIHTALEAKKELLENTALFTGLASDHIDVIADYSDFRFYRHGEPIFRTGFPARELFIVKQGEVLITRTTSEGKNMSIAQFITGDLFGELELLQNSSYNATAHAENDTILLCFPKTGVLFQDILQDFPAISAHLLYRFLAVIAGRIRNTNALIKENTPVIQELKKQVYGDKLTGLYNRTYLEERLEEVLGNSARSPATGPVSTGPISLIMIKPDNFKAINDTYGHESGDQALRLMASALADFIDNDMTAVRFKGNELAVLVPSSTREQALTLAKELRLMFTNLDLSPITDSTPFSLSVSIGIALFPEHAENAAELIERAHELPLIGRARGGNAILFPEDRKEHVGQ